MERCHITVAVLAADAAIKRSLAVTGAPSGTYASKLWDHQRARVLERDAAGLSCVRPLCYYRIAVGYPYRREPY